MSRSFGEGKQIWHFNALLSVVASCGGGRNMGVIFSDRLDAAGVMLAAQRSRTYLHTGMSCLVDVLIVCTKVLWHHYLTASKASYAGKCRARGLVLCLSWATDCVGWEPGFQSIMLQSFRPCSQSIRVEGGEPTHQHRPSNASTPLVQDHADIHGLLRCFQVWCCRLTVMCVN